MRTVEEIKARIENMEQKINQAKKENSNLLPVYELYLNDLKDELLCH